MMFDHTLDQKQGSNTTDSRDPDDDIVSRLRDMAYVIDVAQGKAELVMTSGVMFNEAADEIERLRKELEDCENDFEILSSIFNEVRTERDELTRGATEK